MTKPEFKIYTEEVSAPVTFLKLEEHDDGVRLRVVNSNNEPSADGIILQITPKGEVQLFHDLAEDFGFERDIETGKIKIDGRSVIQEVAE